MEKNKMNVLADPIDRVFVVLSVCSFLAKMGNKQEKNTFFRYRSGPLTVLSQGRACALVLSQSDLPLKLDLWVGNYILFPCSQQDLGT